MKEIKPWKEYFLNGSDCKSIKLSQLLAFFGVRAIPIQCPVGVDTQVTTKEVQWTDPSLVTDTTIRQMHIKKDLKTDIVSLPEGTKGH